MISKEFEESRTKVKQRDVALPKVGAEESESSRACEGFGSRF